MLERGRTSAALCVMHVTAIDDFAVGVAYGVVTHGTRDSAITVWRRATPTPTTTAISALRPSS